MVPCKFVLPTFYGPNKRLGGGPLFSLYFIQPSLTDHLSSFAGSDSTASTMQSFFFHVLSDARVYASLQDELHKATTEGTIPSSGNISWNEAQNLHYFQACLKEAMRVRPAVGLNITRTVPPEGAELDGHFFPGGVAIAVNGWVLHRDQATFGADADSYRPERWLRDTEEARRMERYMFQVSCRLSNACLPGGDWWYQRLTNVFLWHSLAVAVISASAATWRSSRSTRSFPGCCAISSSSWSMLGNSRSTQHSLLYRRAWRFTFRRSSRLRGVHTPCNARAVFFLYASFLNLFLRARFWFGLVRE